MEASRHRVRARAWLLPAVRLVALAATLWTARAAATPLTLEVVLESTLRAHPKLAAVEAKVEQAQAAQLSARGAYDLKIDAGGAVSPVGTYQRGRGRIELKQPTTAWGLDLSAKYENGVDFPIYDGELVTSEAGKVTLGVALPLLRDRAIDPGRLELVRSKLGETLAEQVRRAQRAELLASAASSYWKWAMTGQKLEAYRELLRRAEARRDFLRSQAASGALPRLEVVDNERSLLARRADLVVQELEFRRASLALGLYRRDRDGRPSPPATEEMPSSPGLPMRHLGDAEALLREVSSTPAVAVYDLMADVVAEEQRLASNNRLPVLDFEVDVSAASGQPRPYSSTNGSLSEVTLETRLAFGWEAQRRVARGKAAALGARRRELESERRALADRLAAEVEAQLAALVAQRSAALQSHAARSQAEEVSAAERVAFEAGQSAILAVNLREQAALSAYIAELDAVLEYQLAWVELQRLLGRDQPRAYLLPIHEASLESETE